MYPALVKAACAFAFSDKAVNKVNEQRGFFNASLDEILQVVKNIKEDTGVIKNVHIDKAPSAYEYRRTQSMERKDQATSLNTTKLVDNETA
ncbi:MAG: hypothetical protein AAFV85_21265 [Cyanobacteria bacterium J06634_6]